MNVITNHKKIVLSWIFATLLLIIFCLIFPAINTKITPFKSITSVVVVTLISSLGLSFLIVILNKAKKEVSTNSIAAPPQPSKFLGFKIAMWIFAGISIFFTIISICDVISSTISPPEPEFAGFEFLLFIPGMLLPLIFELRFLVFLLAKKNKQAIVLGIIQGCLLLILLGIIYIPRAVGAYLNNVNTQIAGQALTEDRPDLCEKIKYQAWWKIQCYSSLALQRGDVSLCRYGEGYVYECIFNVAKSLKDISVCLVNSKNTNMNVDIMDMCLDKLCWEGAKDKDAICQNFFGTQFACDDTRNFSFFQKEVLGRCCENWLQEKSLAGCQF